MASVRKDASNSGVDDDASLYGYFENFMVQKDALYTEISKSKDRMKKNVIDLDNVGVSRAEGGRDQASGFLDLFETELNRVSETISSQQESQELSAKAFLTNVKAIVQGETTPEVFINLRDKAGDIADISLKLQRFVKKNADILREVSDIADSEINADSKMILNRRLLVSPWKDVSNSALIVVLSDIYSVIRDAETKDKEKKGEGVVPESSIGRSTTKYWIQEDKLTVLLLAAVREAPLLASGKSGHIIKKAKLTIAEGDKLWDSVARSISSVYFDSPTMSLYKERIKSSEGAQLFRVRWYGAKPNGNQKVFLELITYHENEMKVEERCIIQEKDMRRFLSSQNWSKEVAEELCLGGKPTLADEKLKEQVDLCQRMHDFITKNDLRPTVRSMYVRAEFESPDSNSLRLTLDRNVTFIDETRAPLGSWCLPDDAVIHADMVRQVPHPIFEVKLAGFAMPAILQDFQANGTMTEAPKFSKFLTGAASFNSYKLESLPDWAENPAFKEIFAPITEDLSEERNSRGVILKQMKKTINSSSLRFSDTNKLNRVSEMFLSPIDLGEEDEDDEENKEDEKLDESASTANTTKAANSEGFGLRKRKTNEKDLKANSSSGNPDATKKPEPVEPKNLFANERTFIQWLTAALLVVTISVILITDLVTDSILPIIVGIVLILVAIFIVVYAIYSYYRRMKLLESGYVHGYIDHLGPPVLAVAVLMGAIMLLYHYIVRAGEISAAEFVTVAVSSQLTAESGLCFQQPISGSTTLIQYQPSDIIVDEAKNTLLVPSLQTIAGVDITRPESPMRTLVTVPDADFEGITFAGDRLFAVSEGEEEPVLYELEWNENTPFSMLVVINTWGLKRFNNGMSKGITYVPDSGGGSLYIAGDNLDPLNPEPADRGVIYIFDIPAVGDEEDSLTRRDILNSNLLNAGSLDSKIGALYYFEGILYVLNDNDRNIRSWNLDTGELMATTRVPRVQIGFTRQWEGFFLEHRNENNGRLGRQLQGGSSNSSLIVHMALETPPQLWSFAVDQIEGVPGSLIFPQCAAAV